MMSKKKKALLLTFIVHHSALSILLVGCGARRTPDLGRIFADARGREGKPPVIVVPGILGSQLVNRRTGEVVWPSAFRSDDDGLSLPVSPDLAANRDELAATRIVETAELARLAPDVYVYYEMLRALKLYGGYREGDWQNPAPDGDRDTFYVFPYDWRRDNVESARELVRRVEELKHRLNRPDLRFNVVAHSMGGLVARYAAMYGASDLPPEGVAPRPDWAGASFISKIFMFGTPNEGSAEAFATLLEGYSVTEGLRRRLRLLNQLSREDALTAPSLYQLLPHSKVARFLDENLRPLAVDLYDPESWRRYGWAAACVPSEKKSAARGKDKRGAEPKGDAKVGKEDGRDARSPQEGCDAARFDAYLSVVLQRAARFHEAIDAAGGNEASPVQLFAFGGDCEETLAAPVILRDEKRGRWVTHTHARSFRSSSGRKFSRREFVNAAYEPGDGRVTRSSLLGSGLGPGRKSRLYDSSLPLAYAAFACDLHGYLQTNKTLLDNALTLLVHEVTR